MLKSSVYKKNTQEQSNFENPNDASVFRDKKEVPRLFNFFRLGDFYEMFLDDARTGAEVLDITLTARYRGKDGYIPMAGVPYHAVEPYLAKLVRAGYKVAICEQLTEPTAGELVERDVVRIVTPGTLLDEKALDRKQNNHIVALDIADTTLAFAAADLSTGFFQVTQIEAKDIHSNLANELAKFSPSEAILPLKLYSDPKILKALKTQEDINIFKFSEWELVAKEPDFFLKNHFGIKSLSGFDLEEKYLAQQVSAALLAYLKTTQKDNINQIKKISYYQPTTHLILDKSSITNLELFTTLRDHNKKGTLLSVLDNTTTSMGARLLRGLVVRPLVKVSELEARLNSVEFYIKNRNLRLRVRELMLEISDVERLLSRLASKLGNAKDLVSLKLSLKKIWEVKRTLESDKQQDAVTKKLCLNFSKALINLIEKIEATIVDEPPFDVKDGGLIKEGVNERLDELRSTVGKSKNWIAQLEIIEKQKTGISSLKVRYNKVFGYYIEISHANRALVPSDYIRKQTLVNAERYITEDLKKHEEIILNAADETNRIEYQIFSDLLEVVISYTSQIQLAATSLANLDVITNFATISEKYKYSRPDFVKTGELVIKDGRHPVIENVLDTAAFVPNDLSLDPKKTRLILLTGPNMAGKSVYLRQTALIVLMAQMGCFVPASKATITPVDRIFVRSGASDIIASGMSTFMVEMVEAAHILNNATEKSLIVMDEIGRGTSTFDGISVAWAVAEYLVKHIKAKTLFATHYHELQELANNLDNAQNFQVAVVDRGDNLVFLHKVVSGGALHSYGVAVAKLAGLPEVVIKNAYEVLNMLENPKSNLDIVSGYNSSSNKKHENESQIELQIKNLDVMNITPIQALNFLEKIKEGLK